jgi:hypothetical protein
MSKVLNRAELFEDVELKKEAVQLKSGCVYVSEIGGSDYIKLWTDPAHKGADGETDMVKFTPALLAFCIVDENGNRILDDEDAERISRAAHGPFMELAKVARRLNGLSGEEVKNSEETKADSLPSVSASSSDIGTQTNCSKKSQPKNSGNGKHTTK